MRARAMLLLVTVATSPAYALDEGMVRMPDRAELASRAACAPLEDKASQVGNPRPVPLDQLPPAVLEHAVLKTIEGCPVREVVYQGQTYWAWASSKALIPVGARQGN